MNVTLKPGFVIIYEGARWTTFARRSW